LNLKALLSSVAVLPSFWNRTPVVHGSNGLLLNPPSLLEKLRCYGLKPEEILLILEIVLPSVTILTMNCTFPNYNPWSNTLFLDVLEPVFANKANWPLALIQNPEQRKNNTLLNWSYKN
jgi:hypothetical protein